MRQPENNINPPLCTAPWYRMLCYDTKPKICCYLTMGFDLPQLPSSRQELVTLYNHKKLVTLRGRLCTGDIAGTPCESCIRENRHHKEFPINFNKLGDEFQEILKKAKESFTLKKTRLEYPPFDFAFSVGTKCNLRCIMCQTGNGLYDIANNAPYTSKQIIEFCKAIGSCTIGGINIFGGEPFVVKDGYKLIEDIASLNSDLILSIITNGTCIHHHLDTLEKIRNLCLTVSVDATCKNYEAIRRGAKWDRTLENLKLLSKRHKANPHWNVSIGTVVMRTSLPDIVTVAKLARELGFKVGYNSIRGAFPTENVFAFPHLLLGIPWRELVEEAQQIVQDINPSSDGGLTLIREGLEAAEAGKPMERIYGDIDLLNEWERFIDKELNGRPFVLFGMSNRMINFLNIYNRNGKGRIAAVSDKLCTTETQICSIPYTPPQNIGRYADTLVLTCATSEYNECRDFLRKQHPELSILTLPEYTPEELKRITSLIDKLNGKPVVVFCTGGFSAIMLEHSPLRDINLCAFSDNNDKKWGQNFYEKKVVPPWQIPEYAKDVVVLSRQYAFAIRCQLQSMFEDDVTIHLPFLNPGIISDASCRPKEST